MFCEGPLVHIKTRASSRRFEISVSTPFWLDSTFNFFINMPIKTYVYFKRCES
jgi:hypothetical protein